jgi:mannan endo-1,4-beta-mannosidase
MIWRRGVIMAWRKGIIMRGFSKIAPLNAGVLMNPKPLLDSIYDNGFSVAAWVWKYDNNDIDALLNKQGLPNDNNNNNWGTTFKTLSLKTRKP